MYWGLHINSIILGDFPLEESVVGKIELKVLEIFGSYEYIIWIGKTYFSKYMNNDICRRIWDVVDGEDVFRFICDKNLATVLIKYNH